MREGRGVPRLPRPLVLLLRLAALLLATSVVTFALVGASPVDPVKANVGQASYAHMSAEQRAELEQYWGSTTPIWQRYAHWAAGVLRGDLGESLRFDAPVTQVVGERFANSAALMLAAWLLAGAGGLALGVAMGARRGSAFDCVARGACLLLSSTPAFWLGLVALMVFSVWLGWFPLGFSVPVGVDAAQVGWADKLRHLVLPALTIEMASASEVFGGSVLVEQAFSYPGLGQAAVTAGLGGDAPLLVAIALVSALVVFVGNACADVLYGVVDPRVREGRQVRHG